MVDLYLKSNFSFHLEFLGITQLETYYILTFFPETLLFAVLVCKNYFCKKGLIIRAIIFIPLSYNC